MHVVMLPPRILAKPSRSFVWADDTLFFPFTQEHAHNVRSFERFLLGFPIKLHASFIHFTYKLLNLHTPWDKRIVPRCFWILTIHDNPPLWSLKSCVCLFFTKFCEWEIYFLLCTENMCWCLFLFFFLLWNYLFLHSRYKKKMLFSSKSIFKFYWNFTIKCSYPIQVRSAKWLSR